MSVFLRLYEIVFDWDLFILFYGVLWEYMVEYGKGCFY